MRPLRWKSRYRTGDVELDLRNREFVDCLNSLIDAAGQREHCGEMEDIIQRFSLEAEQMLLDPEETSDLRMEFGRRLSAALPLSPYGSNACRQCGLCDLIQPKIAAHLQAPAECLFISS